MKEHERCWLSGIRWLSDFGTWTTLVELNLGTNQVSKINGKVKDEIKLVDMIDGCQSVFFAIYF